MTEAAAAFAAWLGASLVLVSDGRRGLALGMAFATVGLGALALGGGGPVAAVAVLAGGAIATVRRVFVGRPGWAIMPAGSTPRLVTCVAAGLVALWVAAIVMSGAGAALRFAVMTGVGLAGARVLWSDDAHVLLTAAGVLAIAIAAGGAVAPVAAGFWPYVAAALIAAAAPFVPTERQSAA